MIHFSEILMVEQEWQAEDVLVGGDLIMLQTL